MAATLPLSALAQEWATRAYCAVADPHVDPNLTADADLHKAAAEVLNGTGRYWRVTAPDGAVSHLWGTYHSTHPLILDLPDRVEADITAARVVATEVDFTFPTRDAVAKASLYEDWLRAGNAFWRFSSESTGIPDKIIARIRARTKGIGWRSNAPDYLNFGGLGTLLLSDPCDDFSVGILPIQDGRIQMLGMIAGAKVIGLEPADAFLSYMNDPANRGTALSLITVFGSYLHPSPGARETSFALYLEGRIGMMQALNHAYLQTQLGADATRHLNRTDAYLLTERNHTFLKTADPDLATGGMFIAVGAFHLPGPQGMVALLRARGYDVTRVPLPNEASIP